jgi:hypothetical protein
MQRFLSGSPLYFAVLAAVSHPTVAFYLPGVAPIEYIDGARVDLKVGPATHSSAALQALIFPILTLAYVGEQAHVHQDAAAV